MLLLNADTRVTVVSEKEGELEEYNNVTLKDYLSILDKYYNADKKKYKNEIPIKTLKLQTRTNNALKRAGISYICQLENITEEDLKFVKDLGGRSILEIKDKLAELDKKFKEE